MVRSDVAGDSSYEVLDGYLAIKRSPVQLHGYNGSAELTYHKDRLVRAEWRSDSQSELTSLDYSELVGKLEHDLGATFDLDTAHTTFYPYLFLQATAEDSSRRLMLRYKPLDLIYTCEVKPLYRR
jgi:hypothetical protein